MTSADMQNAPLRLALLDLALHFWCQMYGTANPQRNTVLSSSSVLSPKVMADLNAFPQLERSRFWLPGLWCEVLY